MRTSEVLATSWPAWSTKVMVAGGLDRTRANRTRERPGSAVSLWWALTLTISGWTRGDRKSQEGQGVLYSLNHQEVAESSSSTLTLDVERHRGVVALSGPGV